MQYVPRHRTAEKAKTQKIMEEYALRKNAERYNLPRSEIEKVIHQWIFDERHRLILSDRLFNSTTYERLAEKYNLSTQQVKNIVYKAMDRLEKHL
jgi:DNA-directed RNA polymerase sigma subunit (sigma70/sigma32)